MPTECRQQVRYLHHPLSSSLVGVSAPPGVQGAMPWLHPAQPRELSCAVPYFVLLYSTSSSHGHTDAHHGSLSSSSFSPYPYIYPPLFSFLLCYYLGPRSPISHSRDAQYPPTLPSSNDTDIARNELSSAARQKSRFTQAPSAQIDQRTPGLPDKPSRDLRPQARSPSADGTRSRHRTSDRHKADARAHESPDMAPQTLPQAPQEQLAPPPPSPPIERSRKRIPLPPQRDSFQEGARGRTDTEYRSPPSTTRDSAPASRLINNDARIPSGPRLSPLEMSRENRPSDARGPRQAPSSSALHPNSQTDTHAHHESRDKRDKDQMDVDDHPPASITKSTEPSRQLATSQRYREDRDGSAPKRPRAMMDDVEMPARRRSPDRSPKLSRSEWKEPHRTARDDISRAAPSRDERRAPPESSTRTSRETARRQVDMSRPPPSAPTPKLSGTNSMPIGGRGNRFGGSASISPHPPLPSAPFPPPASSASWRGTHLSGSNAQPVVSRPVRPLTGAKDSHERPPHLDGAHDRDRSTKIPADSRRQTERVVSPVRPLLCGNELA
ncbi:hypothetical protein DEU56DRAFT_338359 [Suillus clintonianus]|uniref:uncharacterized protein n=1 Tax=Suillus clintonianus TaxID=1904413 RepID=UPI001B881362|nr:uncharacterized protein DEU56DRAFT_338359 [Suillus clintonianus]KAG2138566.1 hypothetical protein DEU56DRAFT_338359 [Suillus clintonianus]